MLQTHYRKNKWPQLVIYKLVLIRRNFYCLKNRLFLWNKQIFSSLYFTAFNIYHIEILKQKTAYFQNKILWSSEARKKSTSYTQTAYCDTHTINLYKLRIFLPELRFLYSKLLQPIENLYLCLQQTIIRIWIRSC